VKLLVDAPVSAGLIRTERDTDVLLAALVVRKRYGIADGKLVDPPADKPPAAIRYDAIDNGDYGELPPDEIPPRTGTDVIVLGDAVCPEARIATRVEVKVGPYQVGLDVFGDRVWEGVLGALMPSQPKPFVRMPITYQNAYGGSSDFSEYGPTPWYMNPVGKGYYLKAAEAKDAPLPNIESPGAHIKVWDDRPPPVGFAPYPAMWGLKWEKYVEMMPDQEQIDIHPDRGLYDRAHPLLAGKPVEPGPMRITGMSVKPIGFDIPPCPVQAEVTVGKASMTRDLTLEEIIVDLRDGAPDGAVVDLTWRKMFRYKFIKHERRETRVVPRSAQAR
jgi:hypothetical protein